MNIEELPPDPYASLGVAGSASAANIKAAYRKLALKYHPDKCSDDAQKELNTNEFHKIQKAYDIIGNDDERSRYDARIRLNDLLKERDSLRSAARPSPSRSTTVYPEQSFPIRGFRVEERKPKSYDDLDADYLRTSFTSHADFDSVRRPTASRIRSERPKQREATQRRRSDRARERDASRRDSPSAKYEFDDQSFGSEHGDRVRPRAADDIKVRYENIQEGVYRYSKVSPERTRPSLAPRTSTRGSSKYYEPRRSQASRSRDAEILERERDQLDSIHRDNRLFAEIPRRQDRDSYQRMRNRDSTEPYGSRPAPLSPGSSSRYTRSQTEPASFGEPGPPPAHRSSTMPQPRRRDAYVQRPSKLREGATMGDSESSSSSASDRYQQKSAPAQPVRATERPYHVRRSSVDEPPSRAYRIVEPTSSRGKKSSASRGAYISTARASPPVRTRSPEQMSPLERSRDRDYFDGARLGSYYDRKPVYEERGATYPITTSEYRPRTVTYSKRYGEEDISYSYRRRDSDYMERPISSRLSRSTTMPLAG